MRKCLRPTHHDVSNLSVRLLHSVLPTRITTRELRSHSGPTTPTLWTVETGRWSAFQGRLLPRETVQPATRFLHGGPPL